MEKLKCILPNWNEIAQIAETTCEKIKRRKWKPELIIAISRGGLVPARLFADHLGIKDIISIKADHWGITASMDGKARISYGLNINLKKKKILLVDDVTDTGQSMELAKRHLKKWNAGTVKTATLYNLKGSRHTPDFYGQQIPWKWIVFPWNCTEDLVNLTRKAMNVPNTPKNKLRKRLKQNNGIDITEKEMKKIIKQMKYLDQKSKKVKK